MKVKDLKEKLQFQIKDITQQDSIIGQMFVNDIQIQEELSLFDYLKGGWQLSLSIAIDFTGSNGDPTEPSSLHF